MRTWLISGTSSGSGLELTSQLLARGDRVAATSRRLAPLEGLARPYGRSPSTASVDVTDTVAIRETVARAVDDLGRIDVLVNNAGFGLFGGAEELSDRQINTHLLESIQLARAASPEGRIAEGEFDLFLEDAEHLLEVVAVRWRTAAGWDMHVDRERRRRVRQMRSRPPERRRARLCDTLGVSQPR